MRASLQWVIAGSSPLLLRAQRRHVERVDASMARRYGLLDRVAS
jgi:hypothetical protein